MTSTFVNNNLAKRPYLGVMGATSFAAVVFGSFIDYQFIPTNRVDGFRSQIEFVRNLLSGFEWAAILSSPLNFVHLLRYAIVSPFLAAERAFGPAGSLLILMLLLLPLLIDFWEQPNCWRKHVFLGVRLTLVFLPFVVSGRTVLVAAGMGYLVSGIINQPFSGLRMIVGCVLATLSSASVLFSIAILICAGNWPGRTRDFYTVKALCTALMICLFMPSMVAKFNGFSSGVPGYTYQDLGPQENGVHNPGTGPIAAAHRILMRSTVVESYRSSNWPRLIVYVTLVALAWINIISSIAKKNWHPMLIVLLLLSSGLFLEGIALWPILFPLIWTYTGRVNPSSTLRTT